MILAAGTALLLVLTLLLHAPAEAQDVTPTSSPPPEAIDGQPPVISLPAALPPVAAADASGATVNYVLPTATDDVSGPVVVSCDPPPGSLFPLGTTEVRCSAQDAAGNVATASLPITVTDQTPPALTQPASFAVTAPDASGATVSFDLPGAVDAIDGPVGVGCDVPPGTFLAVGDTTVTCTAADSAGNVASVSFVISVLAPPAPPVATDPPTQPPTLPPTEPPTVAPTTPPPTAPPATVPPATARRQPKPRPQRRRQPRPRGRPARSWPAQRPRRRRRPPRPPRHGRPHRQRRRRRSRRQRRLRH